MADSAGSWCLIESDPGVFTELIKEFETMSNEKPGWTTFYLPPPDRNGNQLKQWNGNIFHGTKNFAGVSGVQVEELWSLDAESFENLKPVHGLIFLFKWFNDTEPSGTIVSDNRLDKIFFAMQVINNACATQAILSILLNTTHPDITLGPTLTEFKEFCQSFNSHVKGLALSNSETIRRVHNSFAKQTLFEFDCKMQAKDESVYHFVSYVPIDGRLYELDGLKVGPIDHGPVPSKSDWLDTVRPIIEKRIKKYSEGEIHFNLMAVVSDRKMIYEKKISEIEKQINEEGVDSESLQTELGKLKMLIEDEEKKRKQYQIENIRRKHNYLPLIVELLKILAREQRLIKLYEKAKETCLEKQG